MSRDKKRVADRLDNETEGFHDTVYESFKEIIKRYPKRFYVIDASKSLNEVIFTVETILTQILAKKGGENDHE